MKIPSAPAARVTRVFLYTVFSALLLSLCGHAASAQDQQSSDPNTPTELFIYGTNFRDPLGEVPQSTTVVQEERFIEKGETNFQYEIESIPNLTWSGGSSRPRFFIIRGVGELEQYDGAPNPSVATIIDDIDFSGLGMVVPMFDVLTHYYFSLSPRGSLPNGDLSLP